MLPFFCNKKDFLLVVTWAIFFLGYDFRKAREYMWETVRRAESFPTTLCLPSWVSDQEAARSKQSTPYHSSQSTSVCSRIRSVERLVQYIKLLIGRSDGTYLHHNAANTVKMNLGMVFFKKRSAFLHLRSLRGRISVFIYFLHPRKSFQKSPSFLLHHQAGRSARRGIERNKKGTLSMTCGGKHSK